MLDMIAHEVASAWMEHRRIVGIRVTETAIPGTLAALPISEERARVLRAPGETGLLQEIAIHPADYPNLLRAKDGESRYAVEMDMRRGLFSFRGLPIRHD